MTGADDFVSEGATAADFVAQPRVTVDGGTIDPLAVLEDLPTPPPADDLEKRLRTAVASLNGVDPLRRALIRERLIKRLEELGVRSPAGVADAALGGADRHDDGIQGRPVALPDPEPWPESVNGAELASELARTFRDYSVLPEGADTALPLWDLFTYTHEDAETSPNLAFKSPVMRCGKTRNLTVLSALVHRPFPLASISPAALFRTIELYAPTLLVDEADAFLGQADELRGLLNSGHTRGTAWAVRTVGDDHEPRRFSTWCPKAVALIGKLPATLEDRSIVIPMRRKAKDEKVKRIRGSRLMQELEPLRRKAARWASDNCARLRAADPAVPDELDDRAADNWRPLLAIADCLGGPWPTQAREAAVLLSAGEHRVGDSARIELLGDLQSLFADRQTDKLPSADIVDGLTKLEHRRWPDWGKGGRPITARQIADLLEPFGVKPKVLRIGTDTPRGYELKQFKDAFSHYLPPVDPQHPKQTNSDMGLGHDVDPQQTKDVADRKSALSANRCSDVADVARRTPGFAGWGRV